MGIFKIWKKWYCTPIIVFILGVIAIGIFLVIERINNKQRTDFSFADVLTDLQIKAVSIHFQFAEWLLGDTSVDSNNIWQGFDYCLSLTDILLYGNTSADHSHLPPLKDFKVLREVENIKSLIVSMKMTAGKRSDISKEIGIDPALYKEFKENFLELQEKAKALEVFIEKDQISNYSTWKRLFIAIMSVWICIIGISIVGLRDWEAKQRKILTFPLCCFDQISCWFPKRTT